MRNAIRIFLSALLGAALMYLYLSSPSVLNRMYTELFFYSPSTWQANRWYGVRTEQFPNDAWMYQEIATDVLPDLVIETGSMEGGGALYWASILDHLKPKARVITVDIEDRLAQAKKNRLFQEKVRFILGSSTDPAILDEIRKEAVGKKVLVTLDSDHSKEHVLKELELYAPLVSNGSYLIVQDTSSNGHPVNPNFGPGPMEALDAFLPAHPEFVIDESRERLLTTSHPRGFLLRR